MRFQLVFSRSRSSLVDDDNAGLHHPSHMIDHDLDVDQRITLDRNEVGMKVGRDCAQAFFHPE